MESRKSEVRIHGGEHADRHVNVHEIVWNKMNSAGWWGYSDCGKVCARAGLGGAKVVGFSLDGCDDFGHDIVQVKLAQLLEGTRHRTQGHYLGTTGRHNEVAFAWLRG